MERAREVGRGTRLESSQEMAGRDVLARVWSIVTHGLRRLARESAAADVGFADLDEQARLLDQHYIPTRYPNRLDSEEHPLFAAIAREGLRLS